MENWVISIVPPEDSGSSDEQSDESDPRAVAAKFSAASLLIVMVISFEQLPLPSVTVTVYCPSLLILSTNTEEFEFLLMDVLNLKFSGPTTLTW